MPRKNPKEWARLNPKRARFYQMRATARQFSKIAPSFDWLESAVPRGMICPVCDRRMVWRGKGSRVITLQHDRSGEMRLMCKQCNTRHAKMPGDSFYSLPKDHKYCPECKTAKTLDSFWRDITRWRGVFTYCIPCGKKRNSGDIQSARRRLVKNKETKK
jgi:hypothetical protein